MKTWVKGAIIGGVWGIPFSGILLSQILRFPLYVLGIANLRPGWELNLFTFPFLVAAKLLEKIFHWDYMDAFSGLGVLLIGTPVSMTIGALIGISISIILRELKGGKGRRE